MCNSIEVEYGLPQGGTVLLRSATEEVVMDGVHQMSHWVKHCSGLYPKVNVVTCRPWKYGGSASHVGAGGSTNSEHSARPLKAWPLEGLLEVTANPLT